MNPIPTFLSEHNELREFLTKNQQITMLNNVEHHFRKIFLLSCASYYEDNVQTIIKKFLEKYSNDERVLCFGTNKGIERQYHTYFNWNDSNINSFLGLFGSEFKKMISKELKEDDELNRCMKAFLEIGNERNKMVHENFLSYNLGKTFEEIDALNSDAIKFVQYLSNKFN